MRTSGLFLAIALAGAAPTLAQGLPPTNLQSSVAGNLLTLSWQAPSTPPVGYVIEAGTASGLSNIATVPVGTSTSLTVPVPNGTYFIRVRAIYAGGLSAPSNEVTVTIGSGCAPPSAPTLTVTVSGTTVMLSWSVPASGSAPFVFTLLAGSSTGTSNLANLPLGGVTSFQAIAPPGTYYLRVVASNACGTSVPSNEVTAVVGMPTGSPLLSFTITPNPVPLTGVFAGCAGIPFALKTWVYTLRITNQGTGPFTIASFRSRVTSPLLPLPVDAQYPPQTFVQAFGGATIPPQSSLQGQLCVTGNFDAATLVWTFVDVGGMSFTAPLIQFLPSPF
jgi:hypothetical protein